MAVGRTDGTEPGLVTRHGVADSLLVPVLTPRGSSEAALLPVDVSKVMLLSQFASPLILATIVMICAQGVTKV